MELSDLIESPQDDERSKFKPSKLPKNSMAGLRYSEEYKITEENASDFE